MEESVVSECELSQGSPCSFASLPMDLSRPPECGSAAEQSPDLDHEQNDHSFFDLYLAHGFARCAWRAWEFAVALILIKLYPSSLLLVSIYGLLDNIWQLALGSLVGTYLDRTDRLRGACQMYLVQNMCILASAITAAMCISTTSQVSQKASPVLLGLSVLAGSFSGVGSLGATVSVEREWTKTMCEGDMQGLTRVNAVMRAIDLSCQMVAPLVAGCIMTYLGMEVAIVALALYCAAVWVPEVLLLRRAYGKWHRLREPRAAADDPFLVPRNPLAKLCAGWPVYLRQAVLPAALPLALLYLTVMSFGFLMTSYMKWRGISEVVISAVRGLGALAGLASTVAFPPLCQAFGLQVTGVVGAISQLVCLAWAVLPSVMYPHDQSPIVSGLLLGGLVGSRFGLWLFDLVVNQLLQECVDPTEIGAVNGVQGSMSSLFYTLSFIAGMLCPAPEHFHWLMLGSLTVVALAAGTYCLYVIRGHQGYQKVPLQEEDRQGQLS